MSDIEKKRVRLDNKKIINSKLKLSLLGIQLFDILIHIAVDRLEPLRIVSNVVILVWVILLLMSNVKVNRTVSYVAISSYGLLNSFFMISDRVLTYFTGQELGVIFALIISTLMVSLVALSKE